MLFSLLQYLRIFKGGIVHSSKLKKMTAALCMALIPISVFAAGLGKLNVNSGLGEPLRAEIELLSVTPDELNSIAANIASEEAYANQGIERPASHKTIKIEIVKNPSGTSILRLKSTQPISEPFLDMLIQVDWASGRLLREYTVLLDPPGYIGETTADSYKPSQSQTTQAPVIRSTNTANSAATGTATQSRNQNRNNRVKPATNVESEAPSESSGPEYVTQRGDSLAKIARDMKPEGISLDQMLIGLYQANPNAFDGKNINRLKVGKIIRQPSEQELASVSRQQASKEVKVQSANWNAYRNKLAGIVAESAPSDSETSTQSADGKIKSAAEDQSLPAQAGSKDVVKLSAGETALTKKEAEDVKSLQAKITALQEESTAREKSVKEAQDKTAALEKQIEDMQKLLALKNGAMSEIQKQAELQAAHDKNNAAQANQANPVVAENPAPAEAAPAEPVKTEPQPVATEANKPEVKVNPAPVVALEPVTEPSLLDDLDLPLVGSVAGLLVLLGGGWLFLRNKRKRNLADFEHGIMTSGGLKANTVFGNTSGSSVDTGDTSFLTDFSQSANGGMIDTNDVDPIAEAEVYMAYGRDAQAEEILKDAISKEPKRYELHLKLLEMYAANKNVSAFETIAGELYTTLGAEDPTWAKVSEIGQKLEPSNPLYQANTAHSSASEKSTNEKLDANDFSDSPIASETDLDFSFDNESLLKDSASTANSKDAFDFDLDSLNLDPENTSKIEDLNPANLDDAVSLNIASDQDALRSDDLAYNPSSDTAESELDIPTISEIEAEKSVKKAKEAEGLDFDFGQLSSQSETIAETKLANSTSDFGHTMPGLDMSGFNEPKSDTDSDLKVSNENKNELDFIKTEDASESFEFPKIDEPDLHALNVSEVDFADENASTETDFNFDLSTLSPEAASYVDDEEATVKTFDLSTINLEMEESATENTATDWSTGEPIEIETKLDLVAAYLDMDDKEGAKELLDEVLKEGGTNQRKRAEALLAKIA